MASCIEKFPDVNSEEYKTCLQKQQDKDAWSNKINTGAGKWTEEEEVIVNDFNKAITLTKEDEEKAIEYLNNKTKNLFDKAGTYTTKTWRGNNYVTTTKTRSEEQIKKFFEDSDYSYDDYLVYKDTGNLPALTDSQIEEEKDIIIKNNTRDFLEEVDDDLRKSIVFKLAEQQNIAEDKLGTNKDSQARIVTVDDKGNINGGELFDIDKQIRLMSTSLEMSRDKVKPEISRIEKRMNDVATFMNADGESVVDINKKIEFLQSQLELNDKGQPLNTPSNKVLISEINLSSNQYNKGAERLNVLSNESEPSAKFFEEYEKLALKRDELISNYETLVNEEIAALDSGTNALKAIDTWQRSYRNIDQLWTATQSTVNDVVMATAEIGELVTQAFRGTKGLVEYQMRAQSPNIVSSSNVVNWFRSIRNGSLDNTAYLNSFRENKLPETIKLSEIRNTDDFINYSMDAVMNNIPQTAMAFAGPAVATGWFTLSGLGNKAGELGTQERKYQNVDFEGLKLKYEEETDPFEKMYLKSEIDAYDRAMNTNQVTKFLAMTVHGLAESIPARMFGTIKIAQGIKDVYRFVPKNTGAKFTRGVINAFGSPVAESLEEGVTNTVQNLNSRYILGEDVSIFDNLDEAMVQGFIIGKGFTSLQVAPNVYGALVNVSQTKQDKKIVKDKVNQLNQILDNLNNPELNKSLTKKGAKQLKMKAENLVEEIVTAGDVSLDRLSNLSFLEITALGEVDKKMNNVQMRYVEANKAGLQPDTLKLIKKDLQTEYDILQNQKADILGGETRVDEQLEEGNIVKDAGKAEFEQQVETGKKILGDNLVIIDENTDLSKLDITSEEAAGPGVFDPKTGKIYINPTAALDSEGNVNVVAHEILHAALDTYVKTDAGIKAIESFYTGLDGQTKNAIDKELKKRGYMPEDAKDTLQSLKDGDIRVDEILTQYLDLVESKDSNIDIKSGTLQQINDFIVNFLNAIIPGREAKFETAGDVRRFLVDYRGKFKKGEVQVESGTKTDSEIESNKPLSKALKDGSGNINALAVDMAKKGYDNLTTSEINTIKDQYTNVALAAIKYDVGKGTIKQADAQAFVDAEFAIIARNYRARNPETNKKQDFTTYIYNTVGRRGANLYGKQEGLSEAGQTTSLDDTRAQQIADPGIDTETTSKQEVTPTIEVFDFIKKSDPNFDSKKFEKDFTDGVNALAKEKGIDLSNPDLTPKQRMEVVPYKVLADAIGIPVKKITDPKANLTPAEASKAQKILSAAKPFIKNVVLSKANTDVTTVESKKKGGKPVKVGGETLGLGTKILNTFFNPPKRLGSGKKVRTPKKFDNKLFNEAIGVKDGKVSPDFDARNSQIIKGLLKAVAEQMAGRSTSRVIPKDSRAQAELDSMKGGRVLSKKVIATPPKQAKKTTSPDNAIKVMNKVIDGKKGPLTVARVFINGLKIIKKSLQSGLTFQKALTRGLEYIKNNLKSEAAADIISSEIQTIDDLRNKTEKELETIMEDVQDAIDNEVELGKQNKQYTKDLNKLNIKDILDVSKFGFDIKESTLNEIKSRRLNKKSNEITNDFINRGKTIVSAMPIQGKELFIDGKNKGLLQGLLGFQYRYVGSGKGSILFDNISSKPAAWVSKRTKDLFAALPKNIITANNLKIVQNKINEAKTRAEKIQIAKNNLAKIKQHQIDVDAVYYANQSLLSDYVYSAKNEKDLANKIDYVAKVKSTNTNNIQGDRALVKVNGFYIGPTGVKPKLEHVKTSSEQSIQGLEQILSGDIETSITNDFEGVYGFEFDNKGGKDFGFAKIDEAGPTNTSQYSRFSNFDDSKNYILAEYGFEGTIADKNILNVVNQKAKERENKVKEEGRVYSKSSKGKKAIEKRKQNEPKNLDKDFNDILQENKGIKSEARYSDIGARRAGRKKGKFKFFLPPGAEDFKGLIYTFLGKGKKGEKQFEFFDNNLIKPYQQAVAQIERFRRALKADYATLLKDSPDARKKLGKKIPTKGKTDFTYDQAVRAFLMDNSGFDLTEAGLSKRDAKLLVDTIKNDPVMSSFAQGLQLITKQDTWLPPNGGFDVQTIQSDLHRLTSGEGRKKFLENSGFMENSSQIFNKANLNKIEATYGIGVRESIEDMMYRMKNGTNRPSGTNRLTNSFNNWVNRSIGAIMFFNRKSALLQTISSVNFINWGDNNPVKAAAAFANQPQYWKDFTTIFNSPKLKERRAGLKGDINEAELASAVEGATNKAEAALSWLLKKGFLPTQMADSFAIASGGATFYRNRVNTYKKQGMDQKAAEEKAFEDFSRISEESQQSADPSMISEQQASPLGRLILAFQNTPMQYTRLMKRAGQDLIAGRGDAKTHISKIIYYGAIQNFMFAALQNALFALIPGFSGEDEEEEVEDKSQKKYVRIANNMVDTVLRGSGVYGAIGATLKNTLIKFYENEGKDPFQKDNAAIIIEAINLSPPIGSKVRKLNNALKTREYEKDVIEERGWEITRDGRVNLSPSYRVLGSTLEAALNIPLERTIAEISALTEMTDQRNSSLERIALALGWRTWDIGVPNEEEDQIKVEAKERKKQERKDKLKREREEKKRLEEEKRFEGLSNKEINNLKRRDQIQALTKQQQIDSLVALGVSKAMIRGLRLESDRIDKIIEINTK